MAGENFSDVFASIGAAKVVKRGEFARPGKYLFEVAEVKLFKGNSGPTHVAEFIVREAEQTHPTELPSPVGSIVSAVNVLSGPTKDVAPSKIKGFTEALLGMEGADAATVSSAVLETVNDDANAKDAKGKALPVNPCKGMLVRAYTTHFRSKKGTEGESLNFVHVPGQKKAEILARAAAQT